MLRPVNSTDQVNLEPLASHASKASDVTAAGNLKAYASKPNGLVNSAAITGESVDVSPEGREKLGKLKEAEFYAKQSQPEDIQSRRNKVEHLKALVATGTISEYFQQLDSRTIADSVLGHRLKPSLT